MCIVEINMGNFECSPLQTAEIIFQGHFPEDGAVIMIADNIIKLIETENLTRCTLFLVTLNLCYERFGANPWDMRKKLARLLGTTDAKSLNCKVAYKQT